jgi:hypothetical protein
VLGVPVRAETTIGDNGVSLSAYDKDGGCVSNSEIAVSAEATTIRVGDIRLVVTDLTWAVYRGREALAGGGTRS